MPAKAILVPGTLAVGFWMYSLKLASPQVIEAYLGSRWVKRQEQLVLIERERAEALRIEAARAATAHADALRTEESPEASA